MTVFSEIYSHTNPNTPVRNEVLRNATLSYIDLTSGRLDPARIRATAAISRMGSIEQGLKPVALMVGLLEAEVLLAEGFADSAIRAVRNIPMIGPSMAYG
jgi:hypothetical protein